MLLVEVSLQTCLRAFTLISSVHRFRVVPSDLVVTSLGWAVKGVVGAAVGGPPCRTASQCPIQMRALHRFGIEK